MPTSERVREYYVHDRTIRKEIAGHPIKERGTERVVLMLASQAEYWLDQGAIGTAPAPPRKPAAKKA